jgi:hypothetical protein
MLVGTPMRTQRPKAVSPCRIVRTQESGIANGAEDFRGKKAEAADVAQCACFARAWRFRAKRLARIFDQKCTVGSGQCDELLNVAQLAIKMNRNDGASPWT